MKIDSLFAIDTEIGLIKPSWHTTDEKSETKQHCADTTNATNIVPNDKNWLNFSIKEKSKNDVGVEGIKLLSRNAVTDLTKKLKPEEMKIILSLSEHVKKLSAAEETAIEEAKNMQIHLKSVAKARDEALAKLQVTEQILKDNVESSLAIQKVQMEAFDVLAFLDLQTQNLKMQNKRYANKLHHSEMTLQLHVTSTKVREAEFAESLSDGEQKYKTLESSAKSQKKILVKVSSLYQCCMML